MHTYIYIHREFSCAHERETCKHTIMSHKTKHKNKLFLDKTANSKGPHWISSWHIEFVVPDTMKVSSNIFFQKTIFSSQEALPYWVRDILSSWLMISRRHSLWGWRWRTRLGVRNIPSLWLIMSSWHHEGLFRCVFDKQNSKYPHI